MAGARKQLEADVTRLERDKELLAQKLSQTEQEAQVTLRNKQAAHEEDMDRLQREKVQGWGLWSASECNSISTRLPPCRENHVAHMLVDLELPGSSGNVSGELSHHLLGTNL